uniref:MHC class II beta chain n=1 Tax=Sphenodon punctatus TaxID=8508 RepID=Q3YJ61_SPHPU|nr:MHC class II beta chain [Sphenodon punctatus]
MGAAAAGEIPGAGSRWAGAPLLVMLLLLLPGLRPLLAHGAEPPEHFLYQAKAQCLYPDGTGRIRYLKRYYWGRQEYVCFDSDRGLFEPVTELGRPDAELWNSRPEILPYERGEVERWCRHNYGATESFTVQRRVGPRVKISPTQSDSLHHPTLLVCSVTGFYPSEIEIKWFRNGQEETAGAVSTELLQNGDWTFQILVMLETAPRRGDVYTCQVEHASLGSPVTVQWEPQSDSARSKMLTGIGGFVLGLIFLTVRPSRTLPAWRTQALGPLEPGGSAAAFPSGRRVMGDKGAIQTFGVMRHRSWGTGGKSD